MLVNCCIIKAREPCESHSLMGYSVTVFLVRFYHFLKYLLLNRPDVAENMLMDREDERKTM